MKYKPDYSSRFRILKGGKISLVVSALVGSVTILSAAPSGGVVTSGSAIIEQSGTATNITQSTQKTTINWQDFSIGVNESVNFVQPNVNAIALNRVVGNEKSVIDGALNANGQVWILNSNGVLFNSTASINTAGLVATTASLSDEDFNAGNYNFKSDSSASVINMGTINISDGGYASLLANTVSNEGTITAIRGTVTLTGASEATINLNGNSLVTLSVNKGVLDALVENKGAIIADGGAIYLTTNAVDELLKGVVNNSGVIEASSIDDMKSEVILFAHGGEVQVGGSITSLEGFVETSGRDFTFNDATIKAGEWLIDPVDITINQSLADAIGTQLHSGDVIIQTDATNTPSTSNYESGTNGDIFVTGNIIYTGLSERTLTLKAYRNIVFGDTYLSPTTFGSISSTNAALNTVLWSGASGTEGSVWLPAGSSLSTNGGDITIGGGSGTSIGNALGSYVPSSENNAAYRGVSINGNIDANGGDIILKGKATSSTAVISARGVSVGGNISTSGNGNISIFSEAKGVSDAFALGDASLVNKAGNITFENGSLYFFGVSTTSTASDSFDINSGSSISSTGTGGIIIDGNNDDVTADATSYINVNNLQIINAATVTLQSTSNSIGKLAANVASVYLLNRDALEIGSIGGTNGISATGIIDIATLAGNLTLTNNISTTNTTSSAITLNAGKNSAAGTSTGGNIIVNGGILSTGSGGMATLYSGNISESTGLTSLVGSGSGNFRYNSDESTANYTTALSNGLYAIYREQPILSITPSTASSTYGSSIDISGVTGTISGYINGDDAADAGINGAITFTTTATDTSAAGTYNIAYNNGLSNGVGYAISDASGSTGEYTINKADATVTANSDIKTYNGQTQSVSGFTATGLVNGETISVLDGVSGATASGINTGVYNTVLAGTDENYNLTFVDGSLTITAALVVPPLAVEEPTVATPVTNTITSIVNTNSIKVDVPKAVAITTGPATVDMANATQSNIIVTNEMSTNNVGQEFGLVEGSNIELVSVPKEGGVLQAVSLSEVRTLMAEQNDGTQENLQDTRVALNENSIAMLINGGVNLPEEVDQEFYIVKNENSHKETN